MMTNTQRQILRVTLGLNLTKTTFRNHFYCDENCLEWDDCQQLVEAGYMRYDIIDGDCPMYSCTSKGYEAVAGDNKDE